jgi:hypothetical protein
VYLNASSRPHLISHQIAKLPLAKVDPRQVFGRRHILHTLLCLVVRNLECNAGLVLLIVVRAIRDRFLNASSSHRPMRCVACTAPAEQPAAIKTAKSDSRVCFKLFSFFAATSRRSRLTARRQCYGLRAQTSPGLNRCIIPGVSELRRAGKFEAGWKPMSKTPLTAPPPPHPSGVSQLFNPKYPLETISTGRLRQTCGPNVGWYSSVTQRVCPRVDESRLSFSK